MEPDQQSCINSACPAFGKSETDTIRVYSCKERRYYCVVCGKTFSESRASLFYHLRTPRRDVLEAIGMLAERNSLRGIARVKGVKPDTVLHGLEIAGAQAAAVSDHLIHNLHLTQAQIDELWTFVKKSLGTSIGTKSQQGKGTTGFGPRWPYPVACASPVI
jgi:transposase-like protein